jgi:hypothetical protein
MAQFALKRNSFLAVSVQNSEPGEPDSNLVHSLMRNIPGQDVHSQVSPFTQPGQRFVRRQNWEVGFTLVNEASARYAR